MKLEIVCTVPIRTHKFAAIALREAELPFERLLNSIAIVLFANASLAVKKFTSSRRSEQKHHLNDLTCER